MGDKTDIEITRVNPLHPRETMRRRLKTKATDEADAEITRDNPLHPR